MLNTKVAAPTNSIEFTGVLYFSLKRVNQAGRRLSHPATIGSRVLPAKFTLACAKRIAIMLASVRGTTANAAPRGPNPTLNSCGIGAMRSIWSPGIMARTELVPRMNISTIAVAATIVARVMLLTGSRDSPAWIATYSNPANAPNPILASRFRLKIESTGVAERSGLKLVSVPFAT